MENMQFRGLISTELIYVVICFESKLVNDSDVCLPNDNFGNVEF